MFGIEERTATGVRGRRGKFEQADGGTLFLDEVSDLSSSAQAKLLRVIQDPTVERVGGHGSRRVDVRIVVATNVRSRRSAEVASSGRDLFYRLNAIEIAVPPLRARRDDIPYLVEAILQRSSDGQPYRLSVEAMEALMVYEWPGNVRELERVIERAITLAQSHVIDGRRPAGGRDWPLSEAFRARRMPATTRCGPGAAATRATSSGRPAATSARPAASSTSAITRCAPSRLPGPRSDTKRARRDVVGRSRRSDDGHAGETPA